jgi:hypothetical protein
MWQDGGNSLDMKGEGESLAKKYDDIFNELP